MSENFLILDYAKVLEKLQNLSHVESHQERKRALLLGSAVALILSVSVVLASRALENSRIFGLFMPEKGLTPKTDMQNARALGRKLKIRYKEIRIERGKMNLLKGLPKDKLAGGNFSARLRMSLLYYYAATNNLLVLGTADKSELMIGYFTKFGDSGADIFPIAELYKSQVKLLAKELRLPEQIIQQKSSPRFWKGQLAEKEIGLP